jgi:integrase
MAHLRRWERKGISQKFVVEWNGNPVRRINKSFRTARKIAGLDSDVVPHVLRHTAATWLMQRGIDIWEAAGYVGMSAETLERVYGHHHPRHLENARTAITRQKPDSCSRTEQERSLSVATKKYAIAKEAG